MSDQGAFSTGAGDRLRAVRARIEDACRRSRRDPGGVTLVAVSKTVSADRVLDLARAGQYVFGENRVQEARDKIQEVERLWEGPELTWRMIGHLQRNKASMAVGSFDSVDSVDSFRLLNALRQPAKVSGKTLNILLQFNCSGEATKGGFEAGEVSKLASTLTGIEDLRVRGLMTIGPLTDDTERIRASFRLLGETRDRLQEEMGQELPELSMGMSDDLEIAVEEGATLVRVGTALFGSRE